MNATPPNLSASRRVTPGFNASLCIPPICYGVSSVGASVSSAKVNSEYRSVREQSGIYAGDGGYAIRVKGNTDLTGAVIASEASADKNHLKTGTLTVRDLENEAHYKSSADSVSASFSGGTPSQQDYAGAATKFTTGSALSAVNSNLLANAAGNAAPDLKGKASGTTHSAIAAGSIEITDEAGQQALTGKGAAETVASLNRDTAHANDGALDKIFSQEKVAAQREFQKASAELAQQAAPIVYKQVGDFAEKQGWKEGSAQKVVLHGLAGALLSAVGKTNVAAGFTSAAVNQAMMPVMLDYLKAQGITEENSKDFKDYLKLGSTIIGAIAGGAASGGQLSGAAIGAATAQTATTHNYLKHTQIAALGKELQKCNSDVFCEKTILAKYRALSDQNDNALRACADLKCVAEHLAEINQASKELENLSKIDNTRYAFDVVNGWQRQAQTVIAPQTAYLKNLADDSQKKAVLVCKAKLLWTELGQLRTKNSEHSRNSGDRERAGLCLAAVYFTDWAER